MQNNPPSKPKPMILPQSIAQMYVYIVMALTEFAWSLSCSLNSVRPAFFNVAMILVVTISSVFDRVVPITRLTRRAFSQIFMTILHEHTARGLKHIRKLLETKYSEMDVKTRTELQNMEEKYSRRDKRTQKLLRKKEEEIEAIKTKLDNVERQSKSLQESQEKMDSELTEKTKAALEKKG